VRVRISGYEEILLLLENLWQFGWVPNVVPVEMDKFQSRAKTMNPAPFTLRLPASGT